MPARPENEFPTILQLRDRLAELIDQGLGELPVQIVVVPDSTMQAIARSCGDYDPAAPALMIDLAGDDGRMPVGLISVEGLMRGGMPSRTTQ